MNEAASVLFRGGRRAPNAPLENVLVASGVIAAIGDSEGRSGAAEVVDLDGRILLPGLWDRHVHFDQWAHVQARVDLSRAGSASEAARMIAAHAAARETDTETTVIGYGFRDALWPDLPRRETLDAACARFPVVLISADLHSAWLNTAALRRFGRPDDATGLLRESAAMEVIEKVAAVPDATSESLFRAASEAAASRGVVGIVDMEKPWSLESWRGRMAGGNRVLRVVSAVWPERLDDAISRRVHTGDVVDESGGLLAVGPLKVIIDGSLNTRTAACHEPYFPPGSVDDNSGVLLFSQDELSLLMSRATEAGFASAVHAIGDRANAVALEAFARTGARGSIEHAQLLDAADVSRFARLGVIASVQPAHALDDRDVADRYWPGRTGRAFPLRSLLDAGAMLAFGSDAPVSPLDPWLAIAAAVHRTRDERPRWHPEQEISVAEALTASMPPGRGGWQLRAGDPADVIALDADPFSTEPAALRTMPVAATMVAGNWTYRRGV